MSETTVYNCDVCQKPMTRWVNVSISDSHYGKLGRIWGGGAKGEEKTQACSIECTRKLLSEKAGAPLSDDDIREILRHDKPDLMSENERLRGEIDGFRKYPVIPVSPVTNIAQCSMTYADFVHTIREILRTQILGDAIRGGDVDALGEHLRTKFPHIFVEPDDGNQIAEAAFDWLNGRR